MGRDHTLFALVDGRVKISKKILPNNKEFVGFISCFHCDDMSVDASVDRLRLI